MYIAITLLHDESIVAVLMKSALTTMNSSLDLMKSSGRYMNSCLNHWRLGGGDGVRSTQQSRGMKPAGNATGWKKWIGDGLLSSPMHCFLREARGPESPLLTLRYTDSVNSG